MIQVARSQVRFPIKSLDFSIELILPAAIWPWGHLNLKHKSLPGIFLGRKGGRFLRLTTSPPSLSINVDFPTFHNPISFHGLLNG
jgi:hypothetical protein